MKHKCNVNPVAALFGIALAAAPLVRGQISYLPITGDTDCEISSVKVYTHAVDFGSGTPRALINGVQFQAGGTAFGAIAGTSATVGTGTTTIPTAHGGDGGADPYLNGASPCDMENLVRDMNYNDSTAEITLTGLTPGQPYRFRLYNRVWGGGAGSREQNIGFDTNGVGTTIAQAEATGAFNPDNATNPDPGFANWWQVNACTYEYTLAAGVTQFKVYLNATGGGTFHLYGLTNEEAGPDETPPVIAATNPADNSSGIYPGTSPVATFSEDIALTGSGTITITDDNDGSGTQTINLPNASVVTVSGADLIINPASNLEFGTNYSVKISSSAIRDLAETPNAFAGIADSTTWNFTTAATDGSPPVLAAVNPFVPADGATDVLVDSNLSVTFDENILINSSAAQVLLDEDFESDNGGFAPAGTPNDWAYGTPNSDNNAGLLLTTGNGGSAKCWATHLGTGGTPSGTIDTNANSILHSPKTVGNGINLTGIATAQLKFAAAIDSAAGDTVEVVVRDVVDGSALVTLTPFTPAVSAGWAAYGPYDISAAVGKQVYLEFRYQGTNSTYIGLYIDDVRVTGVGATDMITLKDLTHMTDTVIPVNDSSQVSVSGSTLTINPAAPLAPESNYAIQIGSTAVRNYNELNFAGIAGTTIWNFVTTGPKTLTWSPSGGGASDGAGTWLATGKWWDGAANVNWGNSTPDNAVIGNGGAGGDITLGAVNARTVLIDNFTGTYAFKSGSFNQSGGITIGANAGNVNLESPISGTGGITVNAPGRVNFRSGAKTFTGDLVITGGAEVLEYNMDMGTGNLTLNGGVLVDYWGGNMNRTLGSGPGQVQILGGESGFSGQGAFGVTVRLNNSASYEVVWGASGVGAATGFFNPSKLILQSPWANLDGYTSFQNPVDLNGTTRTVKVNKDHGATNGSATMSGVIRNSDTGNAAGLIKEGPGRLILTAANTYNGGTTVTDGKLSVNSPGSLADASMTISAGTVNGSGTLTFNVAGATIDKIVMTGGTLTATGLTVNVNGSLTHPEYVLVDATGGGTIAGTFAGLTGAPGYTLDYGTANQVKLVGAGGGSAYDTWATGGESFDGDANGDGVKDGLAFLLGAANPGENASGRLPTVSKSGAGLVLTFNCLPVAARGGATLKVEHSSDLGDLDPWTATADVVPDVTDAVPDNNVTFVVGAGPVGPPALNSVTATISSAAAGGGKLFGRLVATE